MAEAKHDGNHVPTLIGVSSVDSVTPTLAAVNPVNGRVLVDLGSSGTVTSVSVVSANGFAGTVATSTTTPAITLSTTVTGLLKGNGTAISAASSSTDYAALAFKTIAVSGQSDVVADSPVDTLTLVGSGITITTNATTDTITFTGAAATPGGSTTQLQYNNAGAFGGISGYTTDGTSVTVANDTPLIFGGGIGNSTALKTGSDGTFLFDTGANQNIKFKGTNGGGTSWGYTDGSFNYVFRSDSSGNATANGTITTGTNGGTNGNVTFNGSTSGSTALIATAAATGTITLPAATGTVALNNGSNLTIASQAIGDILTATSTTAYGRLAAVATGSVLASAGTGTAPAWSSAPQLTTIELGAATDTTLARVSAGVISVEGVRVITSAGTTSGTILKNNGTTFVASTETYAAPGTSGNVLTSDGTNWTSAAPAGGTFSGASVIAAGGETNGTFTWTSENYDTASYHDNGTNPSRFTIPTTGKYLVTATVAFSLSLGTINSQLTLVLNGATTIAQVGGVTSNSLADGLGFSLVYAFTANDYIEVAGTTNTGSMTTIVAGSSYTITKMG